MKLILSALIIISTVNELSVKCENCTPTSSYHMKRKERIRIGQFEYLNIDNVNQIKFECDLSSLADASSHFEEIRITIFFKKSFILNETLDFRAATALDKPINAIFFNLKGFDIGMKEKLIHFKNQYEESASSFSFLAMPFDFYHRGKLIDEELCNTEDVRNLDVQIFSNIRSIQFVSLYMVNPVCPYVFRNSNLNSISFSGLENNFLIHENLEFIETTTEEGLNSSIFSLWLQNTKKINLIPFKNFYEFFFEFSNMVEVTD